MKTKSILVVLLFIANIVTILVMMNNQQVTNGLYDLVGTSETIRIVSLFSFITPFNYTNPHTLQNNKVNKTSEEKRFNEWLAGIIDGDGHLSLTRFKYSRCEITMDKMDYHTLMLIKNKLGGSVKLMSGVNAYRYGLYNREGMINLINRINGNIRNSQRIPALMKVCSVLDISYIPAVPLTPTNAWYSGFFDADGSIYADFDNNRNIIISVTNKHRIDVESFLNFNGNVYFKKGLYGYYEWIISSKSDILNMLNYFKINPVRSHKLARLSAVNQFYALRELKAYKIDANLSLANRWNALKVKWSKWE